MFSKFLAMDTTYPTQLRDFPEWHKGIKHYGFWAIEVSSKACHDEIDKHKAYFSDKLHSGYSRQPHVTLAASGLMSDMHFNQSLISKQIKQLKENAIKAFSLKLSHCNSFSVCPYLSVLDPQNNLNAIRECLTKTAEKNNPENYTPHVTLGFYDKAYATTNIVNKMSNFDSKDIEFMVKEIVFAQYETKDVQGPYQVLHRIKLADVNA